MFFYSLTETMKNERKRFIENSWVLVFGYPGAGKTIVKKILKEKGIVSSEFSNYFKAFLNLSYKSRKERYDRIKRYIQTEGRENVILDLISWVEDQIDSCYRGPIFLIGARNSKDVNIIKDHRPVDFCVLIKVKKNKRIQRLRKRARNIDTPLLQGLEENDEFLTNPEISRCIKEHKNYIINNNGAINKLEKQIEELLNKLE